MPLPAGSLLLYLVTDAAACRGRDLAETVEAALGGGVTMLQYREKSAPEGEARAAGSLLRDLCRRRGIPFIVNDRVDLALALGADGVHLGREDMTPAAARRLLGEGAIIGLSVGSAAEAAEEERRGADYLGASPVFSTPTKPDAGPPLGLSGLRELVAATTLPVVAIGGIGRTNAAQVMACGCAGIAVVSAILSADDPEAAAHGLLATVANGRSS